MYLREVPDLTLSEFADMVNDTSESVQVSGTEIVLDLTSESRSITIGNTEVPATKDGIEALGRHLRVPPAFLYPSDRAFDAEEAQYILGRRLARNGEALSIHHTSNGITGVYAPGATPINPRRVVEVALSVMDPASQIIEHRFSSDETFFDVSVPFGQATGDATVNLTDGAERQQVGDLTAAGLRFTQNRARNLTPTVDPFAFRLWCTNGMSLADTSLPKVDARVLDGIDDVMRALEIRAEAAFSIVEQQIQHFYDLRNQPVTGDATQALLRLGDEQGIPERIVSRLARRLPAEIPDGEQATMFHLVNLLTNEANNPAVSLTGRRTLEMAGGTVVSTHADRCGHCQSRLN